MNLDGYDDRLYLADLAGRVWRVDLTTNPWSVSLLFDCGRSLMTRLARLAINPADVTKGFLTHLHYLDG